VCDFFGEPGNCVPIDDDPNVQRRRDGSGDTDTCQEGDRV
jgi:hypothetical protein